MTKYAIVQAGSHQYRVEENTVFHVEKLASAPQGEKELQLNEVLFVQNDGTAKLGQPFVPQASVTCEVLGETKLPKVISFKFKRRKGYKKKKGHRQNVLCLRVKSIQAGA